MFKDGSGRNRLDLKCVCLSHEGERHKMKWKAQAGGRNKGLQRRKECGWYKRREKQVKEGKGREIKRRKELLNNDEDRREKNGKTDFEKKSKQKNKGKEI